MLGDLHALENCRQFVAVRGTLHLVAIPGYLGGTARRQGEQEEHGAQGREAEPGPTLPVSSPYCPLSSHSRLQPAASVYGLARWGSRLRARYPLAPVVLSNVLPLCFSLIELKPLLPGCHLVQLVAGPREAVSEWSGDDRMGISGHLGSRWLQAALGVRQTTLHDQFHRTLDGNAHLASRQVGTCAVVLQKKILAGVHIGRVLIPIVGLQARRGEALRHAGKLPLLERGVRGEVLPLAGHLVFVTRHAAVPLVGRAILLEDAGIDGFTHHEAEDEEDEQKPAEARQKGDDATDVDVLNLVTGVFLPALAAPHWALSFRVKCVVSLTWISVHAQAPKPPRCAGR